MGDRAAVDDQESGGLRPVEKGGKVTALPLEGVGLGSGAEARSKAQTSPARGTARAGNTRSMARKFSTRWLSENSVIPGQ